MVAAKLSSNSAILAPVTASSAMYAVAMAVPFHTPALIVPRVVIRLPVTILVPPIVIASASKVPSK